MTKYWLNRDPEGEDDGPNLYAFVQNQPTFSIDPLGLSGQPTPPPPPDIPGGPWKWYPDPNDSRGGKFRDKNGNSAGWDEEDHHWDVDDGSGTRKRYNRWGKPLTKEEAHGCKNGPRAPIENPPDKKTSPPPPGLMPLPGIGRPPGGMFINPGVVGGGAVAIGAGTGIIGGGGLVIRGGAVAPVVGGLIRIGVPGTGTIGVPAPAF